MFRNILVFTTFFPSTRCLMLALRAWHAVPDIPCSVSESGIYVCPKILWTEECPVFECSSVHSRWKEKFAWESAALKTCERAWRTLPTSRIFSIGEAILFLSARCKVYWRNAAFRTMNLSRNTKVSIWDVELLYENVFPVVQWCQMELHYFSEWVIGSVVAL